MKYLLTLALTILSFFSASAQVEESQEDKVTFETPKSIKEQFEFIYNKSNNYTDFKVVKRNWLVKLKEQTLDSLKNVAAKLNTADLKIKDQQAVIVDLNKNLDDVKNQLTTVSDEKDAMPFLGINMTKASYSTLMWSIVGLLLVLLAFFIYKFNSSNVITKDAKQGLKELELEFEDHRRRALEREQVVMRKLQDELNRKK